MLYQTLIPPTPDGEALMHDVTIPALGMAMTEAVLTRWYKRPGDAVVVGDVLAEIETDKSTVDLESPAAGILGQHLVAEGTAAPIGEPVVRILEGGESEVVALDGLPPRRDAAPAPAAVPAPDPPANLQHKVAADPPAAVPPAAGAGDERAPHALSPRQRRLAREVAGDTPTGGATATGGKYRAAIAERVTESWRTMPHFAVTREIDASPATGALVALRTTVPDATHTDLLLHALGVALTRLDPAAADVGLAVATPDGVLMPVVVGVVRLGPAELVAARAAAVTRAREGRLSAADLSATPLGSLSNLGSRGVDSFTGVIALGQQVLLTVGRIAARPVVVDGVLAARPTVVATLNVDHRRLDGDRAASVLEAFADELGAIGSWVEGGNA
jgi:pyruvate dehydrogenase E2 component (dihydrolipoamide acetyltransferase)